MGSVVAHLPCFWTGSPPAAKKISRPLSRLQKQATSWTTSSKFRDSTCREGPMMSPDQGRAAAFVCSGWTPPGFPPRGPNLFNFFFRPHAPRSLFFRITSNFGSPFGAGMFGGRWAAGVAVLWALGRLAGVLRLGAAGAHFYPGLKTPIKSLPETAKS